jgi:antitoxin YefM
MKTMTYSDTRQNLAATMDAVIDDAEPVEVTRVGHEPVVIVSKREWESLQETAYLLRSPANARRLLASIDELEAGRGTVHELIEVDE